MWLRRTLYRWLPLAALVLPLWLLIGWGIFHAGGWAFLWVLFIAVPSVLIGQALLTLLVRLRPSARSQQALSWPDVIGFALWHGMTIAVGFYPEQIFLPLVLIASAIGLGMFGLMINQLWAEARGQGFIAGSWGVSGFSPEESTPQDRVVRDAAGDHEIIVVREQPREE